MNILTKEHDQGFKLSATYKEWTVVRSKLNFKRQGPNCCCCWVLLVLILVLVLVLALALALALVLVLHLIKN